MAGTEDLSRAILKLLWKKDPAILRTQANLQLQSPMQDVPLLEKTQPGF